LRVLRSADRYRPDAAFKTWLYRIVINLCLDARRRLRNQPVTSTDRVDQPDPAGNPDSGLEENELIRRVRRALRELPERQCVALVLHRYHGLSYRGIAEATGWSVPAVESLIVRAFAQLRAALSDIREESAS
ncbi:MAG: RNA polymerase sigma factor, partial [Phycisphaerae bacterium]